MQDIILFGMQWSGKGTQAKQIMEHIKNLEYFEPGNIFRALNSNDNIIWKHVRDRMAKWEMLDDQTTYWLFDIYGHLLEKGNNMLLDWFPRSMNQLHYLLHQLHIHGDRQFIAIYFDVTRDVAMDRLLKRAVEQNREDDTAEAIEKRLDIYEKQTMPLIDYLESIGKLHRVDANWWVEGTFEDVKKILNI